jgi:MOSC domain-containing protein YiiM
MKLLSVNIGLAARLPGKPSGKSGIFKHPVSGPVLVDELGLVGDAIVNKRHHGGVDQAVYIEMLADYVWWSTELGRDLPPGTFGENLLIEGLENREIQVGDRFEIGTVVLEVTSARIPCATFAARMEDRMFVKRYTKAARPGAYARVIQTGSLQAGDKVSYQRFDGPSVTMPEMLRDFGKRLNAQDRARYLATPVHYKLKAELEAQQSSEN